MPSPLWLAPVFSGVWPAAVAPALMVATAGALGVALPGPALALGFCGALCVYVVDRLRDLERDRACAPERSAFVARHRRRLSALAGAAGAVAAVCALALGGAVVVLCAAAGGAGLLHRRLKRAAWATPLYVSTAWVAVVVGVPVLTSHAGWWDGVRVGAPIAAAVLANVVASGLRRPPDSPPDPAARWTSLSWARGLALAGIAWVLCGPRAELGLAAVPGAQALALAAFRPHERYGLVVLDGALLAGGVLARLSLG